MPGKKEQHGDPAVHALGTVQLLRWTSQALPDLYATHKLNEIDFSMIKLN